MSKDSNTESKSSKSKATEPVTPRSKNLQQDSANANGNAANTTGKSPSQGGKQTPAPTIDQYNSLKQKLTAQILRKQLIDAKLTELEDRIYDKEGAYFQESAFGNIVKGFDNFGKTGGSGVIISGGGGYGGSGSNSGGGSGGSGLGNGGYGGSSGGAGSMKRKIIYTDDDHIFSLSSTSYMKTLLRRQGILKDEDSTGVDGNERNSNNNSGNGDSGNGSGNNAEADFDDYEDSVDPTGAVQHLGGANDETATPGTSTPAGSATPTSSSGRKRKIRSLDD